MQRLPLPPFTRESAQAKTQAVEDALNTRSPEKVVQVFSPDCVWRSREEIFQGQAAIKFLLKRKWGVELHYRLVEELWAYTDNRISVRCVYEWQHFESSQWYRSHSNEHWEFNADGYMTRCDISANDIQILVSERSI